MNTPRCNRRAPRRLLTALTARSLMGVVLLVTVSAGGSISAAGASPILAAKAKKATVITIDMGPVKYNPSVISVVAGTPVILRFINKATIDHEALIGDAKEQDEHEKMMKEMPGMAHHGVKGFVDVKPGKTKDIAWTFPKVGVTFIGCHKPAHYKGGMKLRVVVKSSTGIA